MDAVGNVSLLRMAVWISVGVVPIWPGAPPVWKTFVRMPAARRATASWLAAASVDGLVMTIISSPQRSRTNGGSTRTISPLRSDPASLRCGCSQGEPSWSLKLCDPPSNLIVTSTEFRTFSVFLRASYWAAGTRRLPRVMSRDCPRTLPSAAWAGTLPGRL